MHPVQHCVMVKAAFVAENSDNSEEERGAAEIEEFGARGGGWGGGHKRDGLMIGKQGRRTRGMVATWQGAGQVP